MRSEKHDAETTLRDYVGLQRGTTYKSALLGKPGPVLLGLASIRPDGGFRDAKLKTYGGDSPKKLLLSPGEIYVSLKDVTQTGDLLGAVARVPADVDAGRLTQDTVALRFVNPAASQAYVYWLLRTPEYRSYCRSRSMGTTNLSLSREDFLTFPVPSLTTQRQVLVNVLEALEAKAESNRRVVVMLAELLRQRFLALFGGDWIARFHAGREPARGTTWGTVSDIVELRYGKALKRSDRTGGQVAVVGSSGVIGWHSESLVPGPCVVVGRKGTAGKVTWIDHDVWPIDTTFFVRCRDDIPLAYAYQALNVVDLPDATLDSAVPGLNRDAAYARPALVPDHETGQAFAEFAAGPIELIRGLRRETRCLLASVDEVLVHLFPGRGLGAAANRPTQSESRAVDVGTADIT